MSSNARPGRLAYIAYCYGSVLPAEYDDWVRNDLTGKGAWRRNLMRISIPAVLIVVPLWLIPASVGMHLAMSLLLLLPFLLLPCLPHPLLFSL